MATTTPNFGWAVPTSSDLVKNGATAIETLGDSIDASMVDLRGGTVGQTLVKASATEMDFAWSSTPSASNPILNSSFDIWARGTSISVAASTTFQYSADRWALSTNANQASTVSRQATGDTTNLPFIQYCSRVQRNSGQTGAAYQDFYYGFDTASAIPLAGKTITLSFYARRGSNYSATSNLLKVRVYTGTGTDQNFATGYTGNAEALNTDVTLTTTWQRFTTSVAIGATITEFATLFTNITTGTASTNDYYEITGVQYDIGSVALPYRRNAATIQGETSACQRYYLKSYNQATAPATASNTVGNFAYSAISTTSTHNRGNVRFPVAMRTTPTITIYSTSTGTSAKIFNEQAAADVDGASQYIGESGFHVYPTSGTPALGNQLLVHYVASAEL